MAMRFFEPAPSAPVGRMPRRGDDVTAVKRLRRATMATTFAYLAVLAIIAFWPSRVDHSAGKLLYQLFAWLYRHDAPRWIDYAFLEFSANIVLFVPVGLFIVVLAGARRWWLGIFVGILASSIIELGQLLFLPARLATVNDVIANSTGAAVGVVLATVALAVAHRHERHARVRSHAKRRVELSPQA